MSSALFPVAVNNAQFAMILKALIRDIFQKAPTVPCMPYVHFKTCGVRAGAENVLDYEPDSEWESSIIDVSFKTAATQILESVLECVTSL